MQSNRIVLNSTCVAALFVLAIAGNAASQTDPPGIPQWAAIVHQFALKTRDTGPAGSPTGIFPPEIPKHLTNPDADGAIETYNANAPTQTRTNPFFQSLGSNGRACVTCHEPRSAWTVSATSIQQRFEQSGGNDAIFRLVDGATCDKDDVSTPAARREAYSLLLSRGLIRIFLPLPAMQSGSNLPRPRDYKIIAVQDPYGCSDLSSMQPIVSVYRRPLPAANLRFLTQCAKNDSGCAPLSIMWDGREPSLASQAKDATLGHGQAPKAPTDAQIEEIVSFESGIYDAQLRDSGAGRLAARGAMGGADFLAQQPFSIGINDSLSPGFNNIVFTIYDVWRNLAASCGEDAARGSIARGEAIFNAREFTISDVGGLNLEPSDPLGHKPLSGFCTTCHDSPNVGNHSEKLALNIGVADRNPEGLNSQGLPVFTVQCTDAHGSPVGGSFDVTDLGRGLISGKCADVGKFKGPILRGLAARAPYFHNGSAATLEDVVNFYNHRFSIGLSDQEKADLVAFLKAL